MRAAGIVAAVAAGASVLAACTDREVTEPDPVPVTTERLSAALVTAGDVPGSTTAADGPATLTGDLLTGETCDDPLSTLSPELRAATTLQVGPTLVTNSFGWFPGAGGAAETAIRDSLGDCATRVMADGTHIRGSALDFGVLSDDVALSSKLELDPPTGAIEEIDVIVVRRGDLVGVVVARGPRPSDKEALDAAARTAIGRVSGLHEDVT